MIAKTGDSATGNAAPHPGRGEFDTPMSPAALHGNKLLFVVNVDWFFMSHRLPIALEAMRQGYEVHLATGITDRLQALRAAGLTVHQLPLERSGASLWGEIRTFGRIAAVMRALRPDVVHLVTVKPVVLGGIAARMTGVPAVVSAVSGLGFVFTSRSMKARLLRAVVLALYRAALGHPNMKVVFQNNDDRRVLQALTGLPQGRTTIVRGSGVDLHGFAQRPFPGGPPVVLFAGRLLRDKGVEEFVAAARLLRERGVQATFRLAGAPDPGNRASVSPDDLRRWQACGDVELLGHQLDMPQVLADAHIVVLPSYREGFPKVLVEAAACGRPSVTTDVPGCRDAIIAGETGLLVPPRDAQALANAIGQLAGDAAMRMRMGLAARELAEREYDIGRIVQQHLALYRELQAVR
jgi:glycosyltransferase involved in cell wall biosynthesis